MRRTILLTIGFLIIVAVIVVTVMRLNGTFIPSVSTSQLTGLGVSSEEAGRPILGVVVENSPQARPQTGLGGAGVIFETVTEGGITRYLALYQAGLPTTVGPVRSLRPYFVDWAMGFDAAVAHVGGSPEALSMVQQLHTRSLNQFNHPGLYFRSNQQPPHNVYVDMGKLLDQANKLGYTSSNFGGYPHKDDSPASNPQATDIHINFSTPQYLSEFQYQKGSNSYTHLLAGQSQIDQGSGKQLEVKNVVVIKMPGTSINAVGSGEAVVFYDGRAIQARWQKSSHTDALHILDTNRRDLPLNRGPSWIAALPRGQSVTY